MWGGVSSDYVDLGLPSGLLWAKKNLGAETEEDAGLYFQWGDTQGYTAEQVGVEKQFTWDDYKFLIDLSSSNFSKYNKTDVKTVLDLEDDAVHTTMGGNWRMPTYLEFAELITYTDAYLVPVEGAEIKGNLTGTPDEETGFYKKINWGKRPTGDIKGMKFYKKGDSSIYMFVPAVSDADDGSVQNVGKYGELQSSTLFPMGVMSAWGFRFNTATGDHISNNRFVGIPIRGVCPK